MDSGDSEGERRPSGGRADPAAEEALEWFTRLHDGRRHDPQLLAGFESWLRRSPRHVAEFEKLREIWGSDAFEAALRRLPAAQRQMPAAEAARPAARRWQAGFAIAAAILLAIGLSQFPSWWLLWQADYLTATGEVATIALPDGSTMMLNTASAVALDFEDGRRDVELLKGEAFFDVRHDPAHPFHVAGAFGEVEVKGTAFSVRLGREEERVILERGRVEVSHLADPAEEVTLSPGEMVKARQRSFSTIAKIDAQQALAWREGRLVFTEAPFGKVLAELERYYGGTVLLVDSDVARMTVTGNYRLDDIAGAIHTLADAVGATMTELPGGLIILR